MSSMFGVVPSARSGHLGSGRWTFSASEAPRLKSNEIEYRLALGGAGVAFRFGDGLVEFGQTISRLGEWVRLAWAAGPLPRSNEERVVARQHRFAALVDEAILKLDDAPAGVSAGTSAGDLGFSGHRITGANGSEVTNVIHREQRDERSGEERLAGRESQRQDEWTGSNSAPERRSAPVFLIEELGRVRAN